MHKKVIILIFSIIFSTELIFWLVISNKRELLVIFGELQHLARNISQALISDQLVLLN